MNTKYENAVAAIERIITHGDLDTTVSKAVHAIWFCAGSITMPELLDLTYDLVRAINDATGEEFCLDHWAEVYGAEQSYGITEKTQMLLRMTGSFRKEALKHVE